MEEVLPSEGTEHSVQEELALEPPQAKRLRHDIAPLSEGVGEEVLADLRPTLSSEDQKLAGWQNQSQRPAHLPSSCQVPFPPIET